MCTISTARERGDRDGSRQSAAAVAGLLPSERSSVRSQSRARPTTLNGATNMNVRGNLDRMRRAAAPPSIMRPSRSIRVRDGPSASLRCTRNRPVRSSHTTPKDNKRAPILLPLSITVRSRCDGVTHITKAANAAKEKTCTDATISIEMWNRTAIHTAPSRVRR